MFKHFVALPFLFSIAAGKVQGSHAILVFERFVKVF
jgi:hypothetical protein